VHLEKQAKKTVLDNIKYIIDSIISEEDMSGSICFFLKEL